jgi:hypothetical protein
MFEHEDPYGLKKRLEFASTLIDSASPASVLEVGCGTGALLLKPLAAQFPDCSFLGLDSDQPSIVYATREFAAANLQFTTDSTAVALGAYDLVIASEVLEHVDRPLDFLAYIRSCLAPDGKVLLTVPNGYGPFELVSTFQILLDRVGLVDHLLRLKRRFVGRHGAADSYSSETPVPMSLAVSPHVNFFRHSEIRRLVAAAGFSIESAQNRTWLCGFLLDLLVSRLDLADWNARIADHMPRAVVSDWMFILRPTSEVYGGADYHPGPWARFRRRLNRPADVSGAVA